MTICSTCCGIVGWDCKDQIKCTQEHKHNIHHHRKVIGHLHTKNLLQNKNTNENGYDDE